jgi:hypothetical protein
MKIIALMLLCASQAHAIVETITVCPSHGACEQIQIITTGDEDGQANKSVDR